MKPPIFKHKNFKLTFTANKTITYSVTEAATVLGVSTTSIYRLVARRLLRPVPGLRRKRLLKAQVHRFAQGDAA